jgi:hypothetical protein
MSLPGLLAQPIAQISSLTLGPIESALAIFNTSPYFIGLMMLILNLGGRFLALEITKEQEQFFQNPWVRRLLIFIVFFVATRSLAVAFWLTIIAVLLLGYLFNENSALCVFSAGRPGSKCSAKQDTGSSGKEERGGGGGMTPEEQEILRRLSEKYQRYNTPKKNKNTEDDEEDAQVNEVYMANMALLH